MPGGGGLLFLTSAHNWYINETKEEWDLKLRERSYISSGI